MSKTVLVPVANGSEEIEACTIVDILRRAGAKVVVASVESTLTVTFAHQLQVTADKMISDVKEDTFDLIALPGGMPGAENLKKNEVLCEMLTKHAEKGKLYGAICASPAVVLAKLGLLEGKKATAYPGFHDQLPVITDASKPVVVHEQCVTGKSPGTATLFALTLVRELFDLQKSEEIKSQLVLN